MLMSDTNTACAFLYTSDVWTVLTNGAQDPWSDPWCMHSLSLCVWFTVLAGGCCKPLLGFNFEQFLLRQHV